MSSRFLPTLQGFGGNDLSTHGPESSLTAVAAGKGGVGSAFTGVNAGEEDEPLRSPAPPSPTWSASSPVTVSAIFFAFAFSRNFLHFFCERVSETVSTALTSAPCLGSVFPHDLPLPPFFPPSLLLPPFFPPSLLLPHSSRQHLYQPEKNESRERPVVYSRSRIPSLDSHSFCALLPI